MKASNSRHDINKLIKFQNHMSGIFVISTDMKSIVRIGENHKKYITHLSNSKGWTCVNKALCFHYFLAKV